jgi:hypothetical protein
MIAAIPARIKFTITAGEAIGIKQVIDFLLERSGAHHARFIYLVGYTHFVPFVPLQPSEQVSHCVGFLPRSLEQPIPFDMCIGLYHCSD